MTPDGMTSESAYQLLVEVMRRESAVKAKQERAERLKKSFREFVPAAWNIVEPAKPFIPNCPHIDAICEHFQAVADGQIQNLVVVVPPGSAKPVWEEEFVLERTRGRIALKDVNIGDEVLTHMGRFRRVVAVHIQGELPLLEITTFRGRKVRTAPDHPFLTVRGPVKADCLTTFDVLASVHKTSPCVLHEDEVVSVEPHGVGQCRCLTVEEDHSFTVNDIAVHNSSLAVLFHGWQWARYPKFRATWASYNAALSTRDSVRCRDLVSSAWYKDTFNPEWKLKADQNEKTYYYNTEKGFRMSTSVDGEGTGHRSHLLGIDDALSTDARFSQAMLDACIRWYDNVWHNRLIDMATGSRIVIGQRVADNDLIGHLLRRGGWELLHIPMEYDPSRSKVTSIGWKDWRKERGELMFPPLFPPTVIEELKKNAEVWFTQYQGEPIVDSGGILKSHKWNYWQVKGQNLPAVRVRMGDGTIENRPAQDLPETFDLMLQSWDLPFGKSESSDFACGQVHAVRGSRRYILNQIKDRMGIVEIMTAIRRLSGLHPAAHLKVIENAAAAKATVEMLEREITGLVLETPKGDKIYRATAGAPEVNAGNWFLPHPMIAPWVGNPEFPLEGGFLASTTLFPFGKNEDDVDAWSQGCLQIQKSQVGGVFGVTEQGIACEPFEFDMKWPRLYGMSVTYMEAGIIWIARRPESGEYYAYAEYQSTAGSPATYADAARKPGDWIQGYMHALDTGRDERDGMVMIARYNKVYRLKLHPIRDSEQTEIAELSDALRTGKLKVFGNLSRFFDQLRSFRREDNGRLPRHDRGLIDALCSAWHARDRIKGPAEPEKPTDTKYMSGPQGDASWMLG